MPSSPWVISTRSAPSLPRAAGWVLASGIVLVLASGCCLTSGIVALFVPAEEMRKAGMTDAQFSQWEMMRVVLPILMAAFTLGGLLPGLLYLLSANAVRRGRPAVWRWLPWVILGHALLLALLGTLNVLNGFGQGQWGAVLVSAVFYGGLLFLLANTYAALRQTQALVFHVVQAAEYPDLVGPGELTTDPWEHH